jgi:uncharacterized protein (DUF952 family)
MPAMQVQAAARATELLALTLYAEAGTRPVRAIEALAALVANRARAAVADEAARLRFAPAIRWPGQGQGHDADLWPLLLGPVCRAPFQFPCWNPRHASHALLRRLPMSDAMLAACRRIAARAAAGTLPDPTGGATHWHDAARLPGWALGLVPAAEIGGLAFYRLGRVTSSAMEALIYTLVRGTDWQAAERLGEYRGSADDARDGFLHFSTAAQVRQSAAKHRAGEADLVLVEVAAAALGEALRWEPAAGGKRPGLFPHLYGALPLSAVRSVTRLPLGADGLHLFPAAIP